MTLERPANRVRVEEGFTYGDPNQALRGTQAEVDLNAETGCSRMRITICQDAMPRVTPRR